MNVYCAFIIALNRLLELITTANDIIAIVIPISGRKRLILRKVKYPF